ncbi:chitobiase/beta-hexosaminidase C-terminal domain-containing protein [Hyalangium rubrum]|uniref:Chitobiase/beta-hexosaminidase C-terminal domain-containing protein n=1 Tax=Hyalangium rubrum TaxID=3103134 RepID=A0ABU5H2P1_9BACT|nr:chitobiase/beta-hexosaminidase C-terminal domain-containing protein [Hyalangium sp. s54d21]MDY7227735.1 chitobiase/beta-hexosaminidase C-terminal domain-containing protein [Hyalangium sp. s54d21]
MALQPVGSLRFLLALVFVQLASACGGGSTPPPNPPPEMDATAPTTRATPAGGTFSAPVTVELTCADPGGSGCSATHYTTDGATPTRSSPRYSAPLSLAANTTLKFFSVDVAGNAEAVKTETYVINLDLVPPTVSASPEGGTYNAAQTVTLTCDDGTGSGCASIRYTTDGSAPTTSSPAYTTPLSISANTPLNFIGVDTAGNVSVVHTEAYVIVTGAPTVEASPAGGTYNLSQSVTLACTGSLGSTCIAIHYTVDGSTPTTSSPTYTAALVISANTPLKFIGVDNAGNVSAVVTETYVIDTVAPIVAANPTGGTYTTAQSVTLTCIDASGTGCASIRYTTNGSTPTTASTQYTGQLSLAANTTLKFIGVDNAGNVSTVVTETYVIDTAAPTVVATPAGGSFNAAQSVTLTCADGSGTGCASIHYTLDDSTPTTASSTYTAPLPISANTPLKFIAVDEAGNVSAVVTETYVIDTVAPTVTASPAGGSFNAAQSVTLTCVDDPGTGCASIHYTLDDSTPTTASSTYTAPLPISANTPLKFIAVDEVGNVSAVVTETYVIDTVAPTVTASPAGGTFNETQTVTLSCADVSGTGCASIHYTLDGSTPTETSSEYTAPLSITTTTTLSFIGVDEVGNVSSVRIEDYVIDTVAPTTTASPGGGVYATEQTVTLTCDAGTGTDCAVTYYTVDGSTPDTTSPQYMGPLSISTNTRLKFFSVDLGGNTETVKSQSYFIGSSPADTSTQIAAVRAAANGTVNLPITLALVTYVKPLVSTDPAGFFLQAEQAGPAVFIAVDPATLTPVPAAGDRVSLTATTKATVSNMVRVTAISNFTVAGSGESVEPLRADVSTVDLPPAVASYESELISITGTLNTAFAGSGTGHVASNLATVGTPSGTNLLLRLPTPLQDQLDLEVNCSVTAQAPLWRSTTMAQASGWKPADITVLACPAPKVLSASASNPTSIAVRFTRHIEPGSVQPNGSQFTFNNGLSASAATVQGRDVLLTTVAQTGGLPYTVTVDGSVRDTQSTPLDATATTATFTGYQPVAILRINEVSPNITSARDLVELYVVQGGNVAGYTLAQETSTLATLPSAQVATGDIIVVHFSPNTTDGPSSETTSKNQFPEATYSSNYDSAWDVRAGTSAITYSSRVLRVKDAQGNTQDGVSFANTSPAPGDFPTYLQALQAEGQWLPANCSGVPCSTTSNPTAAQVSANWTGAGTTKTGATVRRVSATDTNMAGDWAVGAQSLGLPNP